MSDKDKKKKKGFFGKITGGVEKVQAKFLGPTFNYSKNIKTPASLGMSGDGNMGALSKDIAGITNYVKLLVEGGGAAAVGGKPLGNKFYLKTAGKCKSSDGQIHDRYLYVNNIPTGYIPIISKMTGSNIKGLRGLVPGTLENVAKLNPLGLFKGMMDGANPPCTQLPFKDKEGRQHYVANADIKALSPCIFPNSTNPVSGKSRSGCAKGFENMHDIINGVPVYEINELKLKKNPFANMYNLGFGILILYIIYQIMHKHD